MIEKLHNKLNEAIIRKLKEEFDIDFEIKFIPKKNSSLATQERSTNSENLTSDKDTEEESASKKTRGRPSHKELVEEYLKTTDKDSYLLPDLSDKLGIHTSKLRDILPEFNYFYDEDTRLWKRGKKE